jgi:hypothetical protein
MDHELVKILAVEELEDFNDEYVYDVIMADDSTPWFFANDMLVHNSCYFKTGATNKEEAIEIADRVAVLTNKSFPPFMRESYK